MKNELTIQNECYECYYKQDILTNHHIKCTNPDENMIGDSYGIYQGWFHYPYCFDPMWKLKQCTNFKSIKKYDKKV